MNINGEVLHINNTKVYSISDIQSELEELLMEYELEEDIFPESVDVYIQEDGTVHAQFFSESGDEYEKLTDLDGEFEELISMCLADIAELNRLECIEVNEEKQLIYF